MQMCLWSKDIDPGLADWLDTLDLAFLCLFSLELIVKVIGLSFARFWHSSWNRLDFVLVVLSIVAQSSVTLASTFTTGRVFRVGRAARFLRAFRALRAYVCRCFQLCTWLSCLTGVVTTGYGRSRLCSGCSS